MAKLIKAFVLQNENEDKKCTNTLNMSNKGQKEN